MVRLVQVLGGVGQDAPRVLEVVRQRDRERLLRLVLADDVRVEARLYFARRQRKLRDGFEAARRPGGLGDLGRARLARLGRRLELL